MTIPDRPLYRCGQERTLVERDETYLACDLALRVGEILLASGAGAADVTAIMLVLTRASGVRGVTSW
jgi:uncharacterized membrane protein YjjP (DUF1212 family)